MTHVTEQISQLLQSALQPDSVQVIDDSAKHAGHAGARPGGQTHFTVRVVSQQFNGLSRVARHRLVYDALKPLFAEGLHALAIEARTPGEVR